MQGKSKDLDWNNAKPFFGFVSKEINVQRKRIGGDFAVALAIPNRECRDYVRTIVPDCIFVTMNLTRDTQKKRVETRHGSGAQKVVEAFAKMYDFYELAGEDEKNTFNVDISEDMTPKIVMNTILEILEKNGK